MLIGRCAAAALVVLFSALSASSAAAVDGEVLIDQAAVNAGGITPGDAPGFPATLSRRGSYKLSGILSVPAGQGGINVTGSGVSLDLNGLAILSQPPLEAEIAVLLHPFAGDLTVKNGTVAEFKGGIIGDGPRMSIENMRIVFNGDALEAGDDCRVLNSIIAGNGIAIHVNSRCQIEGNIVAGNRDNNGINVGGGSTVLGNIIVSNAGFGIGAPGDGLVGYGDNVIAGNRGGGVQVFGHLSQLHPNVCLPSNPTC